MKVNKVKQSSFVRFFSDYYKISQLENSTNQQLMKDLKKTANTHGLYFLYKTVGRGSGKRKKLYYVGKSRPDILGRIYKHTKDKHKGNWDSFIVMTVKPKYVKLVEAIIISYAHPKGNTKKEKVLAMKTSQKNFLPSV